MLINADNKQGRTFEHLLFQTRSRRALTLQANTEQYPQVCLMTHSCILAVNLMDTPTNYKHAEKEQNAEEKRLYQCLCQCMSQFQCQCCPCCSYHQSRWCWSSQCSLLLVHGSPCTAQSLEHGSSSHRQCLRRCQWCHCRCRRWCHCHNQCCQYQCQRWYWTPPRQSGCYHHCRHTR